MDSSKGLVAVARNKKYFVHDCLHTLSLIKELKFIFLFQTEKEVQLFIEMQSVSSSRLKGLNSQSTVSSEFSKISNNLAYRIRKPSASNSTPKYKRVSKYGGFDLKKHCSMVKENGNIFPQNLISNKYVDTNYSFE